MRCTRPAASILTFSLSRCRTLSRALLVPLSLLLLSPALAQQTLASAAAPAMPLFILPPQPVSTPNRSELSGTILDPNGDAVPGACITLVSGPDAQPRTQFTDDAGRFHLSGLPAGALHLTVDAPGLASFTWSGAIDRPGDLTLQPVRMQLASSDASVEVHASTTEIAAAQVSLEEKQRVLGFFPNFYATYIWNAEPLTARQKFVMGWKTMTDPVAFGATGVVAAYQQSQNSFRGYGQGAAGYAKRYGAGYADGMIGTMVGGVLLPTVLHQDPRYFVKGTGSVPVRALYAVANTVICKGDNGHWQPNYSNVLGSLASAGISNLYYPSTDRHGPSLTITNALIQTAGGAFGSLMQEFALRRMTPHIPDYDAANGR